LLQITEDLNVFLSNDMELTPETPKFNFVAEVEYIAETKFKACLHDDETECWMEGLYAEYEAAGSPKNLKKWITDRIKDEFKSMDKPPAWVDFDSSYWPFHKNKPMVFLAQIPLREPKGASGLVWDGAVAYVFGLEDKGAHGEAIMVYHEVTLSR
jgi:hypothetical protein